MKRKRVGGMGDFPASIVTEHPRASERMRVWAEQLEKRLLLSAELPAAASYVPPVHQLVAQRGFLSSPAHGKALTVALSYLRTHASGLGLKVSDVANARVDGQSTDRDHNTHIRLQQCINGLDVANADLQISLTKDNRVVEVVSHFIDAANTKNVKPALSAKQALAKLAPTLGLPPNSTVTATAVVNDSSHAVLLKVPQFSTKPIVAREKYVATRAGGLKLTWEMTIPARGGKQSYQIFADASSGANLGAVSAANVGITTFVTLPASGWEGQTVSGFVQLSAASTNAVTVNLASSDTNAVSVPPSVVVAAGQTTATFTARLIDDGIAAGTRSATVSASSNGLSGGSSSIVVHDIALDHLAFGGISGTKTAGVAFSITARALNVANELLTGYQGSATLSAAGQSGPITITPFSVNLTSGVWFGNVTLTIADPAITLTASSNGHLGTSNAFAVQSAALASFSWSPIGPSQVGSYPITSTITAKDTYGNVANFNGTGNVSGIMSSTVAQTLLGNLTPTNDRTAPKLTVGYAFTPRFNMQVTHFRSMFELKVSLWTDTGTLLASQAVGTGGAFWTDTPLTSPVTLLAGTTYRIAAYGEGNFFYNQSGTRPTPPFATIGQNYEATGDDFPTIPDINQWMVDLRANVMTSTSLAPSPGLVTFSNGVWSGNLTIAQAASGMHLHLDDGARHVGDSNNFDVILQSLGLSVPKDVRDDDGILAGALNITPAPASDLAVSLTSSDPATLTVPGTITVPAGATGVPLPLTLTGNGTPNALETVSIMATTALYTPSNAVVTVHPHGSPSLSVSIPANASEGDATVFTGTVTASVAPAQDLTVSLSGTHNGRLGFGLPIVLKAGQTSVSFPFRILDDTILDGTGMAPLTASANGYTSGYGSITITDNDNQLSVTLPSGGFEGELLNGSGKVSIGGTLGSDLLVNLASDDTNKLGVPPTVVIPAGFLSTTFNLNLATDMLMEGTRTVSVTASATGLISGNSTMAVHDSNVHHLTFDHVDTQIAGLSFAAAFRAFNIANEPIPTVIGSATLSAAGQQGPLVITPANFPSVSGFSGNSVVLTTADPAVTLTYSCSGLTATSNAFVVKPADPSKFSRSAVTTPQAAGAPFAATLTAFDAFGNKATGFNGTVSLSGVRGTTSVSITPASVSFVNGVWSGNVTVTQSALGMHLHASDGAGHIGDTNNFDAVPQVLALSLPSDVHENDGAISGALNISPAPSSDLTVTLISSDSSRLSAPASIIVPAGSISVPLTLTSIDNALLDGLEPVTISATSPFATTSAIVNLHDNETATISLSIPATAREGDGTLIGTITSSAAPTKDITIQLSINNTARLIIPATIKLLAGQTAATFNLSVIDNSVIDFTQNVTVTAAVDAWTGGSNSISIADNENTIAVTVPASGWEGQTLTNGGTVKIGGTFASDLTVSLSTDDAASLTVPATVTIPAGKTSATFTLTVPSDSLKQGSRTAIVSATAGGLPIANSTITIHDATLDHLAYDTITGTKTADSGITATVRAYNIANEQIAVYAGTGTVSAAGQSGSLNFTPTPIKFTAGAALAGADVTVADPAVVLTATSGGLSASSNPVVVQGGSPANFYFPSVFSPQFVNVPFNVTIFAIDGFGNLANGVEPLTGFVNPLDPAVIPSTQVTFVNGVWSGSVTVPQVEIGMYLETYVIRRGGGDVIVKSNTFDVIDPLQGTTGDDSYYLKADGNQIDLWLNQPPTDPPAIKLPRSLAGQVIHGMGGNDSITIDQSAGDIFPFLASIGSAGSGTIAMRVIGTSGDDAFAVDSTAATVSFASNSITVHNLTTIQYTDNGGNDSASVNGPLPLTLNVGSGIDTLNVATGSNAIVYIHGDTTGDLVIDGSGHTVVWYI